MTTDISWPDSLPEWVMAEGYREVLADSADYTQVDGGLTHAVRTSTCREDTLNIVFVVDVNQYRDLRAFYKEVIYGGTLTFSFIHPVTKDELEVRMISPPEFTPVPGSGKHFRVTCSLAIVRVLNYHIEVPEGGIPGEPPPTSTSRSIVIQSVTTVSAAGFVAVEGISGVTGLATGAPALSAASAPAIALRIIPSSAFALPSAGSLAAGSAISHTSVLPAAISTPSVGIVSAAVQARPSSQASTADAGAMANKVTARPTGPASSAQAGTPAYAIGGGGTGNIVYAASASRADVQAAIDAAANGDTIMIPNGTSSWTGGVSTTKQIVIQAQNYTPTKGGVLARNVTITHNAGTTPLISLTSGNAYHVGVVGIRFNDGTGTGNYIRLNGTGTKVPLIADCSFEYELRQGDNPTNSMFAIMSQGAVLWNIYWNSTRTSGGDTGGSSTYMNTPRSWQTPSTMGMLDTNGNVNVYVEDSTAMNVDAIFDADQRTRLVVRYSLFDGTWFLTHGFTSGLYAGGRHVEIYNNTFKTTMPARNMAGRYFWLRAGTVVITDNDVQKAVDTQSYNQGNVAILSIGDNTVPSTTNPAMQPGWGYDDTGDVLDPIYVWNNTGPMGSRVEFNDLSGNWSGVTSSQELVVDGGPKPGYSKYTYPHPFRTAIGSSGQGDAIPPTISITSPTAGASVEASVTITATASDNVGVVGVQFKIDGNSYGAEDVSSPYSVLWDTTTFGNGAHTITATARDAAGNTSTSAPISVTVSNTASAPPALPTGNSGIAAGYPADANISTNASVVFADNFESYASASQLTTNWNSYYQSANTRIATEAGNFYSGTRALEFSQPSGSTEIANEVMKLLASSYDTLFVRVYNKFSSGYSVTAPGHNGIRIETSSYPGPGNIPNGTDFFVFSMEDSAYYGESQPGYLNVYTYNPEQRSDYGDHWYPDGKILPYDSIPGDWGSYFVARSNFIPTTNQWYCYEFMVKTNTPGQRDGRVAMWVDGALVADFQNVRIRDVSTLKIDKILLGLHSQGNTDGPDKKWYDNLVVATSYIGPLSQASEQTLWTPSDTPATEADVDSFPIELGVRFVPSVSGEIRGIRFYKSSTNTGTHTATLWNATATSLASKAFSGETSSGWQEVRFDSPVSVTGGSTYVASYHAPVGQYSSTSNYFASPHASGNLTASAGLYEYNSSVVFPTQTFNNTNYWVDVIFFPTA